MKPKIVAIIPARGGSKGLPEKNIIPLADKPLIAYTIEAAKQCKLIDRIIVSTDSAEIKKVAELYGAEVPFMRPAGLAQDDSPTEPVLEHAIKWLEENENYRVDIVIFLQPTLIFRKKWMIERIIKCLLDDEDVDSAFTAAKTHKNFWRKIGDRYVKIAADRPEGSRQIREPLYREDTGLASATRAKFTKQGRRLGDRVKIIVEDDEYASIDIHDKVDFWLAEKIIEEWGIKPNAP